MPTVPPSIASVAPALRSGALEATDLIEAALQAIDRHNGWTNAFVRVDAPEARAAARRADEERRAGTDRGPLHGIPISLKDLIDVAGQPTSAGSFVMKDRVATDDALIVTRLRGAGAVLIGKTNLHEFAMGTTSEESAWGPVKHPRDAGRSAGGSSGGSAAAVATGMGLASIGTDTGGSVRIPAAICGIVGLKPSAGDVPIAGVVPLSVSLDHVGPLARTVQDAAWVWAALADQTPHPLTAPEPTSLRLCRLDGYFSVATGEVRTSFESALADLRARGVSISHESIPRAELIAQTYLNLVLPEAALWHARYLDTRAEAYTPEVRGRIEKGRTILAVDYLRAREARLAYRRAVDALLKRFDALVLPTVALVAPPLGSLDVIIDAQSGERVNIRTAMLRLTQLFNITGHPAISLPVRTPGLPVGLQLVGARGQTRRLLEIAAAVEKIVSPTVV